MNNRITCETIPCKEFPFHMLTPSRIAMLKQNKPSLIVSDFERFGIPKIVSYGILLGRGVFKWLAVRRYLIIIKCHWKSRVRELQEAIRIDKANGGQRCLYLRGKLAGYEECRKELRWALNTKRWNAPFTDKGANDYLRAIE